jgi:hypothetical protein
VAKYCAAWLNTGMVRRGYLGCGVARGVASGQAKSGCGEAKYGCGDAKSGCGEAKSGCGEAK